MPNTTPLFRQKAILAFIRRKPFSTFEEIENYVNQKLEEQYFVDDKTKAGFTKRTFQRDLKDIAQIFGKEVKYDKKEKGYHIESDVGDFALEQLMSAFDVINAIKLSKNIAPLFFLEDKKPGGTEHLFGILHAIQRKLFLEFEHKKFWKDHTTNRKVKPLAIKEYRHRWYLVAQDEKDGVVKTFGLDRVSNLHVSSQTFKVGPEVDLVKKFQHYYGIIGSDDEAPTEVMLAFTSFQAKYVKSLPLHSSQKIVLENPEETQISLCIFPTHDFIMELLSFGAEVKVLEPEWLAKELAERHQKAFLKNM